MNQEMSDFVTHNQKRPGSITSDKEDSQLQQPGSITSDKEEPHLQLAKQDEQELRPSASHATTDDIVPTTKLQFLVIFVALILAIFCVALDNTIIVTAIPRITDDYKTLNDVGW